MKPTETSGGTRVESIRHYDTRTNIPTEELRGFVAEDETAYDTVLYPRDPSLDPQLVWRGKDAQNARDLEVPVLPIYIQEKIHPRALIEDLKRPATGDQGAAQLDLFGDFTGLEDDFGKAVEFYQHDQHWSNRMILGDSLLVMNSLAEKEGLRGKVQMIYIDPPYGIKFSSNWQVSTRKRDVKDGKAEDATRQPEQVRAFRDTWELGIHSYLGYMRDRLMASRELLAESGSIFVQIGDENIHLIRNLLDEVFGAENFCALIPFKKTSAFGGTSLDGVNDYLIWYARDAEQKKYRQLFLESEADTYAFPALELPDGTWRRLTAQEKRSIPPSDGLLFRTANLSSQGTGPSGGYAVQVGDKTYRPSSGTHWKTDAQGMERLRWAGRLLPVGNTLTYKRYQRDFAARELTNWWDDTVQSTFAIENIYVVQTYSKVIQRCILMTTDPGDLILDPTCGSGTSAVVAEQWGRRWIMIDTSRVALAIARTRLMAAKYPYYLLADSAEGQKKTAEFGGTSTNQFSAGNDVRQGFVYKRLPRVTLKSIASNTAIHEGMTREAIDKAIERFASSETLYDQPYEDKKTIRVTGPFTVESLSPHRVLSVSDDNLDGRVSTKEVERQQDFATMIIENLHAAGAQNTYANERLVFDTLEPFPGEWLQAVGTYTDSGGATRRVAVSLGPEHGTVGPEQVKEAAKEAMQGLGHDILLVCGFAFDPHVSEEAKRYGKLTVLPTKMNPDLSMGKELLKKTGAGNLFMVFGEPDVAITPQPDGRLVASIVGLDIYDPTTGDIRSSSAGNLDYDIAAWFIDTNYDGESFFVRHAYFTGGNAPYDKLKRALRAEIDEDAWESLYSTTSRPFPRPNTGKIAIKVINHYGDEVLKVFAV